MGRINDDKPSFSDNAVNQEQELMAQLIAEFLRFKDVAVGIDGCKAGWLAVINNKGHLHYFVTATLDDLVRRIPAKAAIFIDMPVGLVLPDEQYRACDRQARQALSPARSGSIFPVPCRQAVYAKDYLSACDINQAATGKRLSKQTWYICHKIAELDRLLQGHPQLIPQVRESHPELCFAGLSQGQALSHNKKSALGLAQRNKLLRPFDSRALMANILANTKRKDVLKDDIVDAFVLMLSASLPAYWSTFPSSKAAKDNEPQAYPLRDDKGLARQIYFIAMERQSPPHPL
ncbi:DUF429 domain-containing protein [Motilimonas pumila]|uniref:DUF429 domain-containing protein n=1 Tax=Motilimonas pumila TaxID=2303987 RepID=A0A418YFR2_9GAMM|nr:DUF429 domain-containing protein [Motilimonas pumila]RJG48094.1 DUF429 domain-containing protein [Motilimonas pumila]